MMNEKLMKFQRRIDQLALMADTLKLQEILNSEYGIKLSEDDVRTLQGCVPKIFTFRLIELWASKQPQEALAQSRGRGEIRGYGGKMERHRKKRVEQGRDTLEICQSDC